MLSQIFMREVGEPERGCSSKVVFTSHASVWRVLTQSQPSLEHEWLIDLPGQAQPAVFGRAVARCANTASA